MEVKRCETCAFWHHLYPGGATWKPPIKDDHGECRIRAPEERGWPHTLLGDWCQEWCHRESPYEPPTCRHFYLPQAGAQRCLRCGEVWTKPYEMPPRGESS